MHYTVLARSLVSGDFLKKQFQHVDSFVDFEAAINHWVGEDAGANKVPYAWCEGLPGDDEIGHMDDQDLRSAAATAWVSEGRAIACFQEDGRKRYVPQIRKTEYKRVRRPVVNNPAADGGYKLHNFGERGAAPSENLQAYAEYMEKFLSGGFTEPVSTAKPPLAGLLRCSSDARERDHLVQACFGRVL